jgi:hypothetical protein
LNWTFLPSVIIELDIPPVTDDQESSNDDSEVPLSLSRAPTSILDTKSYHETRSPMLRQALEEAKKTSAKPPTQSLPTKLQTISKNAIKQSSSKNSRMTGILSGLLSTSSFFSKYELLLFPSVVVGGQ